MYCSWALWAVLRAALELGCWAAAARFPARGLLLKLSPELPSAGGWLANGGGWLQMAAAARRGIVVGTVWHPGLEGGEGVDWGQHRTSQQPESQWCHGHLGHQVSAHVLALTHTRLELLKKIFSCQVLWWRQ